MKVYLAAPYVAREQIAGYAAELRRIGFTVTSSWLEETHTISEGTAGAATDLEDDEVVNHAIDDLLDVDGAELFVLFTAEAVTADPGFGNSGGRHVETGYALAQHKPIIVVGEPENIFHRMGARGRVTVVPNWHEALIELSHRLVTEARDQDRVMAMPG